MQKSRHYIAAIFLLITIGYNSSKQTNEKLNGVKISKHTMAPRVLDSTLMVNELRFLASDSCEGRNTESTGYHLAVQKIIQNLKQSKAVDYDFGYEQNFTTNSSFNSKSFPGKNIIAYVKGKKYADSCIVVTAHYDHLGKKNDGSVFYGADDNASGTACLEALVKYFASNPQPYTLVFVFFDKEETGLYGSNYFVNNLPKDVHREKIKLNVNLDMVARSDKNEIYVCGLKHYPQFSEAVHNIQSKTTVNLLVGHDYGSPYDDWTTQSDHYSFHKKNIPFLYVGVENHEDYHRTTDTFDKVNLSSFVENANMIVLLIKELGKEA